MTSTFLKPIFFSWIFLVVNIFYYNNFNRSFLVHVTSYEGLLFRFFKKKRCVTKVSSCYKWSTCVSSYLCSIHVIWLTNTVHKSLMGQISRDIFIFISWYLHLQITIRKRMSHIHSVAYFGVVAGIDYMNIIIKSLWIGDGFSCFYCRKIARFQTVI